MKKTVVLGITGSIAAYKACEIVSRLKKADVDVRCILTAAGEKLITALTLESLSNAPVAVDMFSREHPYEIEHISLARLADIFVVAPASANFLAKAAHGIADDMLTTTFLACNAPVLIAPAMNTYMYENAATQENMAALERRGAMFVEPGVGRLACGDSGKGRMAEPCEIVERILYELRDKHGPLCGKKIMVTAGATRESLDPVRFLTNRSTGRMGFAIARAARDMGARVTLVAGDVSLDTPYGVERLNVFSCADMLRTCVSEAASCDAVISAAAPCDFTPSHYSTKKIKKTAGGMSLELLNTGDILKTLHEQYPKLMLIGFAAETNDVEQNAQKKLERKGLYAIAANDVSRNDAGFACDTNDVCLYMRDGRVFKSGLMSKYNVGRFLLSKIFGENAGHTND